jgi:hypothetical protein
MSLAQFSPEQHRAIDRRVQQLRDWFDGPPTAPWPVGPDDDPAESHYEMAAIEEYQPTAEDWAELQRWSEERDHALDLAEARAQLDMMDAVEDERLAERLRELQAGQWD